MNWDYKVISLDELFPEHTDHDIAVSRQAASSRRGKLGGGLENKLKELGADGWELITIAGEFSVFKRPAAS
ncbi:MAG: hypothetical protein ACT4NX_03055 [Deltaproteobacteria bacterium]